MRELQVEQLRRVCDPDSFPFQTTDELPSPELGMIINQDRAREAIERALGVEAPGFNAYVVGRPGVGRRTLVERILERLTPTRSTPNDACLVYNFGDPWMPKVIFLPAGEGRKFAAQMAAFTQEIKPLITSVVEDFEDKVNAEIEQLVGEFREEAAQFGYVLQRDRQGRLGLAVDQELPLEERPEETPPPELQQRFLRLALKCEEIRQKAAKPRLVRPHVPRSRKCIEKTSAAKSSPFLVHCLGRSACTAATARVVTVGPATAGG